MASTFFYHQVKTMIKEYLQYTADACCWIVTGCAAVFLGVFGLVKTNQSRIYDISGENSGIYSPVCELACWNKMTSSYQLCHTLFWLNKKFSVSHAWCILYRAAVMILKYESENIDFFYQLTF